MGRRHDIVTTFALHCCAVCYCSAMLYKATITTAGLRAGEIYSEVDTSDERTAQMIAAGFLVKVTKAEAAEVGEPESIPDTPATQTAAERRAAARAAAAQ